MKIVITRRDPVDTPDGINIFIFTLADALLALNHDVTVMSTFVADQRRIQESFGAKHQPKVVCLTPRQHMSQGQLAWTWATRGRKAITGLKPDYVITNGAIPVSFPAPTVAVSHDLESRPLLGSQALRVSYKKLSYRMADQIVATCSELKDALARELRLRSGSIQIIPTCINPKRYCSSPVESRERAIMHIGTIWYKNPASTINAFQYMQHTDSTLYIVGKEDHQLAKLIAELPDAPRSRVRVTGYLTSNEFRSLLGRVRAVSVPSQYDVPVASPTALEALASGTPVVGSPSISTDLLIDGKNGLVVPPENARDLGEAFSRLTVDDSLWVRLSRTALQSAADFSAASVASRYLSLYEELVKK